MYRLVDRRHNGSDRIITRYLQTRVAAVDGRFLEYMKTVYPNLLNDIMQKANLPTNFQHPNHEPLFLPVAVSIHAHENHRHMIMYMINYGTIITSAKRLSKLLLQEGIQGSLSSRAIS